MTARATRAPFAERGGRARGVIDLVTGRYPGFLFGLPLGVRSLPVFHLHEVTAAALEPRLQYLADNGYRTVTSADIGRVARDGLRLGPRAVALCFDDAWASLWTVGAPLLRRFGMTAIAFAIPGRVAEADMVRPTIEEGADPHGHEDRAQNPFATWPELAALARSGTIDVQSHSWSHARVYTAAEPEGFVVPGWESTPILNRPLVGSAPDLRFVDPGELGAPLFPARSRLADGWRYFDDEAARERCVALVRAAGGLAFFDRPDWPAALRAAAAQRTARFETDRERARAIEEELDRSRSVLQARLGVTVRQVCLPWGVGGALVRDAAARLGFDTMFRDRFLGRRIVSAGDDPYSLMRLHDRFIFCLPGRGRRYFVGAA
jgi:peptidoglycan/xylan/chitin deacetylase (PgdA/CDA1 family)